MTCLGTGNVQGAVIWLPPLRCGGGQQGRIAWPFGSGCLRGGLTGVTGSEPALHSSRAGCCEMGDGSPQVARRLFGNPGAHPPATLFVPLSFTLLSAPPLTLPAALTLLPPAPPPPPLPMAPPPPVLAAADANVPSLVVAFNRCHTLSAFVLGAVASAAGGRACFHSASPRMTSDGGISVLAAAVDVCDKGRLELFTPPYSRAFTLISSVFIVPPLV